MTAVVFLKKSYQLSQAREGLWYIPSEDLGEGEALRSRSTSYSSPKLNQPRMTFELRKAPLPSPMPPMPNVSKLSSGQRFKIGTASPGNLLEERDEDVVAALAKFRVMEPEVRPAAPATAPPTPKESPERKPTPRPDPTPKRRSKSDIESPPVPGRLPEWESKFWSKYGNRSRVGQFGHILYIGKMAGEQLPGEASHSGECKDEKLGTQMLEELGRKTPGEDEGQGSEEKP